jgi:hypothetical protein
MGKRVGPPGKEAGKEPGKEQGSDAGARRTFVALPLAQLLPAVTRPAFRARAPGGAALFADWGAIVGPRLAEQTVPQKLSRGQLTIACSGPVGMELQHAACVLIERINAHAGSRVVERLRFVHAAVAPRTIELPRQIAAAPRPVAGIKPGALHDALAALGARFTKT